MTIPLEVEIETRKEETRTIKISYEKIVSIFKDLGLNLPYDTRIDAVTKSGSISINRNSDLPHG